MSSSLSVLNLMLFYVLLKNLHMTNKGIVCFLLELNFYFYIYVHDLFQVGFCIWATAFLCGGGDMDFQFFRYLLKKLPFVHWATLLKICCPYMCGFICTLSYFPHLFVLTPIPQPWLSYLLISFEVRLCESCSFLKCFISI